MCTLEIVEWLFDASEAMPSEEADPDTHWKGGCLGCTHVWMNSSFWRPMHTGTFSQRCIFLWIKNLWNWSDRHKQHGPWYVRLWVCVCVCVCVHYLMRIYIFILALDYMKVKLYFMWIYMNSVYATYVETDVHCVSCGLKMLSIGTI